MTAVPITHPAASRHHLRQRLASLIDRLICTLDTIDGDCDLEEGGDDEPGLGWPSNDNISQEYWVALAPSFDDREDDGSDLEPSLCGVSVERGNTSDLEHECEDEGADPDDEPDCRDLSACAYQGGEHDQTAPVLLSW